MSYNKILPGLFLGNFEAASNKQLLDRLNIRLIVNCAIFLPNTFKKDTLINYTNIPVYDTPLDNDKIYNFFNEVVDKIYLYKIYNKNVFVHCAAGVSRSPTIIVAYLMKYHTLSLEQAIQLVITKRPEAFNNGRNIVFLPALQRYNEFLMNNQK